MKKLLLPLLLLPAPAVAATSTELTCTIENVCLQAHPCQTISVKTTIAVADNVVAFDLGEETVDLSLLGREKGTLVAVSTDMENKTNKMLSVFPDRRIVYTMHRFIQNDETIGLTALGKCEGEV